MVFFEKFHFILTVIEPLHVFNLMWLYDQSVGLVIINFNYRYIFFYDGSAKTANTLEVPLSSGKPLILSLLIPLKVWIKIPIVRIVGIFLTDKHLLWSC